MASLLCIVDQGYRATVEEQDDTAVWMAHMLQRCEGTRTTLVLRGSAVNYANPACMPIGVEFGEWSQAHPADLGRDLVQYSADGGRVFAIAEDVSARGLSATDLLECVDVVPASRLSALVAEHDNTSFW
ncbi:MAG: hypothetical protein ACI8PZ_006401 [Myxococcota bacterium]|jgi:hypothetical protein